MQELSRNEYERHDPLKKARHPDQLLNEVFSYIKAIGSEKFLKGAGHQQKREAFAASLFAYGIRKWSRREWFIQQLLTDPPDFHIISPTDRLITQRPVDRHGVELVEIKANDSAEAIETVRRVKVTNYFPPSGTSLLIFLNTRRAIPIGESLNRWVLAAPQEFARFAEVYVLLINSFSPNTACTFTVVSLSRLWRVKCVLKDEFGKGIRHPHPLIDKHRVRIVDENLRDTS